MELLKACARAVKRIKTQRDVLTRALSSELQRTTTTSSKISPSLESSKDCRNRHMDQQRRIKKHNFNRKAGDAGERRREIREKIMRKRERGMKWEMQ